MKPIVPLGDFSGRGLVANHVVDGRRTGLLVKRLGSAGETGPGVRSYRTESL